MTPVRRCFDASYYERFYLDPGTRAVTPAQVRRQVAFVAAYLKYLRVAVHRILDVGCGLGLMRGPLADAFPRAGYTGVEVSEYVCERMGWEHGSVVDYETDRPFDLVVCHDVVQYLDDGDAAAAIGNLARLSRAALYLGVLTREDWDDNCDQGHTDWQAYLRPAVWYRRRLARHFDNAGGGVYLKRDAPVVMWALERCR